jgi:hypothetical protein
MFFSYSLPAGTLFAVSKIKFFAKILCLNFILQALFQSAQHLYEKREGKFSKQSSRIFPEIYVKNCTFSLVMKQKFLITRTSARNYDFHVIRKLRNNYELTGNYENSYTVLTRMSVITIRCIDETIQLFMYGS